MLNTLLRNETDVRASESAPRKLAAGQDILNLRAGDVVQVRSKEEILATLDAAGTLDALPFMPEMLAYCGQTFRVYKRADKTCDTIRKPPASLRMTHAVHLENVRCDGAAHGGCQASCLIFWKEPWLKRVGGGEESRSLQTEGQASSGEQELCTVADLHRGTRRRTDATEGRAFSCQATELPRATSPLSWWDIRQYVRDVWSGNVGCSEVARGLSIATFNMLVRGLRRSLVKLSHAISRRAPMGAEVSEEGIRPAKMVGTQQGDVRPAESPGRSFSGTLKTTVHAALAEYPQIRGQLRRTPETVLNLQPGELVEVKSKAEIVATLDVNNRNRGLSFDVEMVRYCGGTYRVLRRVEKILNERTGQMMSLPNACIILEEVVCRACVSRNRLFCPRSIYPYWHEVWLRRVD